MAVIDNTASSHWFGTPFWRSDRVKLLDSIVARFPTEEERDTFLETIVNRITDKSGALLQTVSVLAAILPFFYIENALPALLRPPGEPGDVVFPLGMLALSALLLALNLRMVWPRIAFETANLDANKRLWRLTMIRAIQRRAIRLTLSLVLLSLAIAAAIIDPRGVPQAAQRGWACVTALLQGAGADGAPTPASP